MEMKEANPVIQHLCREWSSVSWNNLVFKVVRSVEVFEYFLCVNNLLHIFAHV